MRVLITGINGFVGGHLTEHLIEQGNWDVWGFALEPEMRLSHLRDHVQLMSVDLCNVAHVSQAMAQIQPEIIFHLAGQPFVPESFDDPATTFHTNIFAQLNIFLAMIEHHIHARVLTVTSAEIYGAIHSQDLPIREETPLRPLSPYAVSKIAQDMSAYQYYLTHHLDIVRVRPFNHIGPRQNERFVASAFAQQIVAIEQGLQEPILKVGNLTAQRDFTDVRDMVRAYHLAVEQGTSGEVYNIGSGQSHAIDELLTMMLARSTTTIEVQQEPQRMRPVDIPQILCNPNRFYACTGWEPRIPFEQTVHDILDDWRIRLDKEQGA